MMWPPRSASISPRKALSTAITRSASLMRFCRVNLASALVLKIRNRGFYSSINYSLSNYTSRVMCATNRRLKRSSCSLEHRLAFVDERLHRLLVVRGHGGADQAFGLVVARGGKIEQQGFVQIVLHVAQRNGRPFGKRSCQRERFILQFCVRNHAIDEADYLASPRVDLVRGEHQLPRPRGTDQPRQQPGDA